ncbi:hypothetical protein RRF57_005681 [Xylaria bambusicola]|uniref:Uncharacterized protein n=1 Tax=Xylaria bambusicola TaxID=326684 RepID=A0AAN7UD18_9PEZI
MALKWRWMVRGSTYSSDSAAGRESAHGARGLAEGVAEHIREVCEVLGIKGKSIATGLQLKRGDGRTLVGLGGFGNGDFFQRKEETDESGQKSERQNGQERSVHGPDRIWALGATRVDPVVKSPAKYLATGAYSGDKWWRQVL